MANILYLVHRLPFPPDKGDKVRSFHLLKHLLGRHRVFLGTFVDDPADEVHVNTLKALCTGMRVIRGDRRRAKLRSLAGLLTGQALTVPYFRDRSLADWVERTCREEAIDAVVVVSSAMAQYVPREYGLPVLIDFVDLDSAKWSQYASSWGWPLSWLYRREGRRLLVWERAVAARAAAVFFVTPEEAELFRERAPECAGHIGVMGNGVNAAYFRPVPDMPSPYGDGEASVVFTGSMDYWPNVDAVTWFAREALPMLRRRWPALRFWIVGRNPLASVRVLAGADVTVTGTVPDIRPYLQHASVVVAPLRIARGIQNKILEAMAMARPVVASRACVNAIDAEDGRELLAAESAGEFAAAVADLLANTGRAAAMGEAARRRMLDCYRWESHMAAIDHPLEGCHRQGVPV